MSSRLVLPPSRFFPPAESADEFGLVCIGGELSPEWLLDAYRHGLFPWPLIERISEPQWWSPDPRAIIEFKQFHISRRLSQTLRSGKFTVTSDRDFAGVIRGCATAGNRRGATWLSEEMISAYVRLHEAGHAHSVEAWHGGQLAGGTYGVSIGGVFCSGINVLPRARRFKSGARASRAAPRSAGISNARHSATHAAYRELRRHGNLAQCLSGTLGGRYFAGNQFWRNQRSLARLIDVNENAGIPKCRVTR